MGLQGLKGEVNDLTQRKYTYMETIFALEDYRALTPPVINGGFEPYQFKIVDFVISYPA